MTSIATFTPTSIYISEFKERFANRENRSVNRVLQSDRERFLTSAQKRDIRNKLIAFSYVAKRRELVLTFITLTLTSKQVYEDSSYNKLLNIWLTRMRKDYKNFEYLWVAEKQKNGNIHYHIVTNTYVSISKCNYYWCLILQNSGHKVNMPTKLSSKSSSNPVDVERIDMRGSDWIKKISFYMTKYVTKNDTVLKCKLSGWSRLFSHLRYKFDFNDLDILKPDLYAHILEHNYYVDKNTKQKIYSSPFAVMNPKNEFEQLGIFYEVYNVYAIRGLTKLLYDCNYQLFDGVFPTKSKQLEIDSRFVIPEFEDMSTQFKQYELDLF